MDRQFIAKNRFRLIETVVARWQVFKAKDTIRAGLHFLIARHNGRAIPALPAEFKDHSGKRSEGNNWFPLFINNNVSILIVLVPAGTHFLELEFVSGVLHSENRNFCFLNADQIVLRAIVGDRLFLFYRYVTLWCTD